MWTITATAHTTASADRVWTIYQDTAHWPRWDEGLSRYQPDGPFVTGTSGTLQPTGGPEMTFTLILVEEGKRFIDSTPIGPDAAIIGTHELLPVAGGTRITHTVVIDAPNAEELAQLLGFKQEELQQTVDTLARYAVESPSA